MIRISHAAASLALLALVVGCSSAPTSPERGDFRADDEAAEKAASFAQDMVGRPYRYGGDTPSGFDCSGLVRYSYGRAGISLPRATGAQLKTSLPVSASAMRVGDLLFFDQEGKKFSHVGIYVGGGRFVHAPSSGGRVRIDDLGADYWRRHFVGARRI